MYPRANKDALTNGIPNRIDVIDRNNNTHNALILGQMLAFPKVQLSDGSTHEVAADTLRYCYENKRPVRV